MGSEIPALARSFELKQLKAGDFWTFAKFSGLNVFLDSKRDRLAGRQNS